MKEPHGKIYNFDNMQEKQNCMATIGRLRGQQRIEITKYAPRRTDRQLRYYFPVVVHAFALWLHEENGEKYDEDAAHEVFKNEFLKIAIINKETGERLGERVRSTGELSVEEFFKYVETCRDHLAKYCHVWTPDPDPNHALFTRAERKPMRFSIGDEVPV